MHWRKSRGPDLLNERVLVWVMISLAVAAILAIGFVSG